MNAFLVITQDKKLLDRYVQKLAQKKKEMVIYLAPKTKEYSIDQIKEIKTELSYVHPHPRCYVLENFHHSSLEAQNAFLKSLEEIPNNISFILSAPSTHSLLPTIISRTQIVYIKEKNVLKKSLLHPDSFQLNNPYFSAATKEQALDLLHQMIFYFKPMLTQDKTAAGIIVHILKMKSLLENNNLNPQLTIDNILIFIKKKYSIKE